MDEDTTKMIKERFDALPKMIQDAILSSDYENSLIEIGKKYQLTVEQMGMLEQETTLVMMGLTPTKDFETELTRELKIDKIKGSRIVTEINEKIFLTIRDLLKLMYTPTEEEPSIEETSEKPADMVNRLEGEKELPAGNPEEFKGEPLKNSPRVPLGNSILEQKLSGSFQIPRVETEHTLNNISKDTDAPVKKIGIPNVDPYREIPQ